MDLSKKTKCSVSFVIPYSFGLAEDIAPKLLTTVLNAKGNMKMSQNSRSDLDEFFEKVGTEILPNPLESNETRYNAMYVPYINLTNSELKRRIARAGKSVDTDKEIRIMRNLLRWREEVFKIERPIVF